MSSTRKSILIVDDDPVCRDITRRILTHELKEFDLVIMEAVNGVEALTMAAEQKPDLILMDIAMPVLSGTEAIVRLKGDPHTRSIPVVAITAMVLARESEDLLTLGFDDHISKPIDYDLLVDTVKRYLTAEA